MIDTLPASHTWQLSGWQQASDQHPYYWITADATWTGATPLWMVSKAWGGGEAIIAQRCYLHYAIEIVDALRAVYASRRLSTPGWERLYAQLEEDG